MSVYVLARDVEADLDAIWEYIAKDNPDAADRWTPKLFEAFETFEAFEPLQPARVSGINGSILPQKR